MAEPKFQVWVVNRGQTEPNKASKDMLPESEAIRLVAELNARPGVRSAYMDDGKPGNSWKVMVTRKDRKGERQYGERAYTRRQAQDQVRLALRDPAITDAWMVPA